MTLEEAQKIARDIEREKGCSSLAKQLAGFVLQLASVRPRFLTDLEWNLSNDADEDVEPRIDQ